jgi:hypothetical protein
MALLFEVVPEVYLFPIIKYSGWNLHEDRWNLKLAMYPQHPGDAVMDNNKIVSVISISAGHLIAPALFAHTSSAQPGILSCAVAIVVPVSIRVRRKERQGAM